MNYNIDFIEVGMVPLEINKSGALPGFLILKGETRPRAANLYWDDTIGKVFWFIKKPDCKQGKDFFRYKEDDVWLWKPYDKTFFCKTQ